MCCVHTRQYANGTITKLRQIVPEGLQTVTSEMIKKFFITCRMYEKVYREGKTGKKWINLLNFTNHIEEYIT